MPISIETPTRIAAAAYRTPEGARDLAVCLPAFSPDSVHRDEASVQ
jgi:hypothetical protein